MVGLRSVRGFTLIELLAVNAIVAILAAVLWPAEPIAIVETAPNCHMVCDVGHMGSDTESTTGWDARRFDHNDGMNCGYSDGHVKDHKRQFTAAEMGTNPSPRQAVPRAPPEAPPSSRPGRFPCPVGRSVSPKKRWNWEGIRKNTRNMQGHPI